ncbi:sialate O-acetylesterase [Arthrobacter sp. 9MFCol3.1]|uniref:sialate O-acetylesterase n=1 Tax=Arthrobacter sp. 9MFCol3.1 TaxID=1150398 RepID=UPI0018CC5954|nr:sialate O-acetylesterase [Arthrobacter sp. 9MFCol3.1]
MVAGVVPAQAATTITTLHVFLAVGQSNMSGRGLPIGDYDAVDKRIFQYGATKRTFRTASVPLDMHDTASGISPATTMAREYLKTQPAGVGVLLIPAAHGDTRFTSAPGTLTWSVGAASAPAYDLPALAVKQTLSGIAAGKAAGYAVVLKGVLWHQGEGNSSMTTATYSASLDQLIAYFRGRLSAPELPFVVGRMTPEGIAATPGRANVDKSHYQTPDRVAYTGFAPSMACALNGGDTTHFSRAGIEYLGRAFLAAYRQAVANTQASPVATPALSVPNCAGRAIAMDPTRFLDTRIWPGRVAAGKSVTFRVAGVRGVPKSVSAVVVNLTVTSATSSGAITAYAAGTAKPGISNLNYVAGRTVSHLATVPLGTDGRMTLTNTSSGSVHLIADVSAYFHAGTPSARGVFSAVRPTRLLDTGSSSGAVAGGRAVSFAAGGTTGIPANASAVVLKITASGTKSLGYLTAYATGSPMPSTSNLNYSAGQTVSNVVVVPVGTDGKVTVANTSSGSAQIIADVTGYFLPGKPTQVGALRALSPTRFLDTRVTSGPVAAGGSVTIHVRGVKGIPTTVAAVVVNLTVTESKSIGYLTAFASGSSTPNASNLSYQRGQAVANLAVVPVGPDGNVKITNTSSGSVQIIADVAGYFRG